MINGVLRYIKATVEIPFPEGKMCCNLCPLLETYSRNAAARGSIFWTHESSGHIARYKLLMRRKPNDEYL